MNFLRRFSANAIALVLLFAPGVMLRAQDFGLAVSATPNPVVVDNAITYTLFVTNTSGLPQSDVFVTNAISGVAAFDGATNTLPGSIAIITNPVSGVLFQIDSMLNSQVAQITLHLAPQNAGAFTNQITVAAFGAISVTTNLVTQVTLVNADLAMGMTNAATGVFTNDSTTIGLSVTNRGPGTATDVVVTNYLPASFTFLSVSPATASYTTSPSNHVWNIGTLASGVVTQVFVSVRPTNGGTFSLAANVTGSVNDTNAANNAVTNLMNVLGVLESDLTLTVVTQQLNRQTGLIEMLVQVRNNAATNVPAVRVDASGLPVNTYLYNASGTNAGNSYVLHNAALAGNSTVNLLLEFYRLVRAPLTNYTLTPLAVPAVSVTPPVTAGPTITNYVMVAGGFMIEFPATIGKTYTIYYSPDTTFSNAMAAQPAIVAPANRVQWIDNGPPKTISHPTSVPSRYYRVQEGQ